MAATRRLALRDQDRQGLQYFKLLGAVRERVHHDATVRERAGKRRLFSDPYACVLRLYFFKPVVKRLRSIPQASELDTVQHLCGCHRVSRGSRSEASRGCAPELRHARSGDSAPQTLPVVHATEAEALRGLTAVDGSLLPALPTMAWALWRAPQHRAANMHVPFDVRKGVPVATPVTAGNDAETAHWRAPRQAQRLCVSARG